MRRVATILAFVVCSLPATGVWAQSDEGFELPTSEENERAANEENAPDPDKDSSSESGSQSSSDGQCDYHVDCPTDHVCRRGSCVQRTEAFELFSSADDECGADRRCRIERLKRKNRARRHARKLEEEKHAEQIIDRRQTEQIESVPRLDRPLAFDLRASRMGVVGLVAGYTLFGKLRPELHFVHWAANVNVQYEDESYNGQQPTTFLIPGLYYFFGDSEFAPYGSASFVYGWGSFDRYNTFVAPPGGGSGSGSSGPSELDTEYHAVELGAGVDFQAEGLGGHMRLGLTYRPLIYNQARVGPGQYSEPTRGALENWFSQMAQIDVIFLAGWAF